MEGERPNFCLLLETARTVVSSKSYDTPAQRTTVVVLPMNTMSWLAPN